MNLAWIAAIFSPYEIAEHPNFERPAHEPARPESSLASLIIGRDPWYRTPHEQLFGGQDHPSSADLGVVYASRALTLEGRERGVDELIQILRQELRGVVAPKDLARTAALTLIACTSAAALDDHSRCISLLDSLLLRCEDLDPGTRLVRACVLQQRSLRKKDFGQEWLEDAEESALTLAEIDPAGCPRFELNKTTESSSVEVLRKIVVGLTRAAWSIAPNLPMSFDFDQNPSNAIPSLKKQIGAPRSEILLTIQRDSHSVYADRTQKIYSNQLRSGNWTTFGADDTDLFYPTLAFELLGHQNVYAARRQLAQTQVIDALPTLNGIDAADTLRLFRHSGNDTDLDLLIQHIQSAGPLEALVRDARQILRTRRTRTTLRPGEMKVLGKAADLMSAEEAFDALNVVLTVIEDGGPVSAPGHWQAASTRNEDALTAAVALGNSSNAPGIVASRLIHLVNPALLSDELWDTTVSRCIRGLDWNTVPKYVQNDWVSLARDLQSAGIGSHSASSIFESIDPPAIEDSDIEISPNGSFPSLRSAVDAANLFLRNDTQFPEDILNAACDTAVDAMQQVRDECADGTAYSHRALQPAELAAALVEQPGGHRIWESLLEFLFDSNIPRIERTRALDRLVARRPFLQSELISKYTQLALSAIERTDPFGFTGDSSLRPYPAALRFAHAFGFITDRQAFVYAARLSSNAERVARAEAAKTISALTAIEPNEWALPLALQLSYEPDARVKTQIAQALSNLVRSAPEIAQLASDRLVELLDEDGIAIPLAVLRGVNNLDQAPTKVQAKVRELGFSHPSRRIRIRAGEMDLT
ncbi:hypothetical protein RE0356_21600 [Prescottella equi]|nr:hypothetical protein RE0356_21600 [Prescottella equi]